MRLVLAVAAVLVLCAGCASMGLTAPQNPQQQIAYAYAGVTASLNTLAQATQSGVVSSIEAERANTAILAVKAEIDTANSTLSSDAPSALKLLSAATAALTQVSSYLACKQAKEATCPLP